MGTIVLLFLVHGDVFDSDDFSKDSSKEKIMTINTLATKMFEVFADFSSEIAVSMTLKSYSVVAKNDPCFY